MTLNNLANIEFWIRTFKPRTKVYQREALRNLKKGRNPFETEEERQNKIRALEILLKRR